jgi:hypothetical protein
MAMAGLSADQVDWVVPRQANAVLDATARKLNLAPERVVTVDQHANDDRLGTMLDVAVRDGRIQQTRSCSRRWAVGSPKCGGRRTNATETSYNLSDNLPMIPDAFISQITALGVGDSG